MADNKIIRAASDVIYRQLRDAWEHIFSDLHYEADEAAEHVVATIEPLIRAAAFREAAETVRKNRISTCSTHGCHDADAMDLDQLAYLAGEEVDHAHE